MTTVRPDRTEGGRGSPGQPTRRWPHPGRVLASPAPTRAGHSFRWNWYSAGRPTRPSPRRRGCPCRIRCTQSRPMWHCRGSSSWKRPIRRRTRRIRTWSRSGAIRAYPSARPSPVGRAPGPTPGTVRPSGRDRPLRHRRRLLPRWRGRRRSGGIRRVSTRLPLPLDHRRVCHRYVPDAVRHGHVGLAEVGRGDGLPLHEGALDDHGRRTVCPPTRRGSRTWRCWHRPAPASPVPPGRGGRGRLGRRHHVGRAGAKPFRPGIRPAMRSVNRSAERSVAVLMIPCRRR